MSGIKKPGDTCDEPECTKPHVARGKCRNHYMAWRRATPPDRRGLAPGFSRLTIAERFWLKVDQSGGPDACWPWKDAPDPKGYGTFCPSPGVRSPAHTYAVQLATGQPCPPGREGCHTCDNPPCCNPRHVYYGTRLDNVRDCIARGRFARGERSGSALLTDAAVLAIRQRYVAGERVRDLAQEHGVADSSISNIITGRTWKHVGGPVDPAPLMQGARYRRSPLTDGMVEAIRARYTAGETAGALARDYGVSRGTVRDIVTGRTWKHVGGPTQVQKRPGPRKKVAR